MNVRWDFFLAYYFDVFMRILYGYQLVFEIKVDTIALLPSNVYSRVLITGIYPLL